MVPTWRHWRNSFLPIRGVGLSTGLVPKGLRSLLAPNEPKFGNWFGVLPNKTLYHFGKGKSFINPEEKRLRFWRRKPKGNFPFLTEAPSWPPVQGGGSNPQKTRSCFNPGSPTGPRVFQGRPPHKEFPGSRVPPRRQHVFPSDKRSGAIVQRRQSSRCGRSRQHQPWRDQTIFFFQQKCAHMARECVVRTHHLLRSMQDPVVPVVA